MPKQLSKPLRIGKMEKSRQAEADRLLEQGKNQYEKDGSI